MIARCGAIVFTIHAYLTLLRNSGTGESSVRLACGDTPCEELEPGAWRSFMVQVRYLSLFDLFGAWFRGD